MLDGGASPAPLVEVARAGVMLWHGLYMIHVRYLARGLDGLCLRRLTRRRRHVLRDCSISMHATPPADCYAAPHGWIMYNV